MTDAYGQCSKIDLLSSDRPRLRPTDRPTDLERGHPWALSSPRRRRPRKNKKAGRKKGRGFFFRRLLFPLLLSRFSDCGMDIVRDARTEEDLRTEERSRSERVRDSSPNLLKYS